MKEIQLTNGGVTLVDDEDFERLNQFKWCAHQCVRTVYAERHDTKENKYRTIKMHREILGFPDGHVDHIDGNGLNNQRANLRAASHQENMWNKRKYKNAKGSIYRGVTFNKRSGKYYARVDFKKKAYNIGVFKSEIDAAIARDEVAKKLYGEFAQLNFPDPSIIAELRANGAKISCTLEGVAKDGTRTYRYALGDC